MSPNQTTQCTM